MATLEEIGSLVTKCCRYFERKEPSPATLELWHKEMNQLDPYIFRSVIEKFASLDGWPKNFPAKIREIHNSIKKVGSELTHEKIVESYCRDHHIENIEQGWAEMARTLYRKNEITESRMNILINRIGGM